MNLYDVELRFFIVLLFSQVGFVLGLMNVRMVGEYFSKLNVNTVVLFTCSPRDRTMWLKYISAGNRQFFTGNGVVLKSCEMNVGAFKQTERKLGVFVDYDCECVRHLITEVEGYNFMSEMYSWLFWSAEVKPDNLEALSIELQVYSEAKFVLQEGASVVFYDLYRAFSGLPIRSVSAGVWNSSGGLQWFLTEEKYARRLNFYNITLQGGLPLVSLNLSEPDLLTKVKDHTRETYKDVTSRVVFTVSDVIQEIHNFSVNITVTNNFGYKKGEDGFYDGLLGSLRTGELDISVGGLGMFTWRLSEADFTTLALWRFRPYFFFLRPRILESWTLLINPFQGLVWLTSFVIMTMASVFISIISFYDNSVKISAGSIFLYVSAILGQQGATLTSQWASGRFVLFTSLIFGFMLLNYYSGQVVSALLAPPPATIATREQLLNSPFFLAADEFPIYKVVFMTDKSSFVQELGQKVERTGRYSNFEDGMEKVRSGHYAFETEDDKGYSVVDDTFSYAEICALGQIPMPEFGSYIALKRHSPFKDIFSISAHLMNERGILKRLTKKWQHTKPQCNDRTSIVPVDLENATIALYILLLGAVLGGLILLLESFIIKRVEYQLWCFNTNYIKMNS